MKTWSVPFVAIALSFNAIVPLSAQEIQSHVASQTAQPAQPAKSSGGLNLGKHDSHAPIGVNSDAFEGQFDTKEGIYTGNVIVTQTDYKLRADKVRVAIVDGKPNKIYAYGNVVFETPSGTATGDDGLYDLNDPRTVTLTGKKVVLVKEKSVMRGTKLIVDVDTGIAHLWSQGAQGGRVQSVLQPADKPGTTATKPATGSSAPHTN
jgi:lipopolysaccharide export system protein LptA